MKQKKALQYKHVLYTSKDEAIKGNDLKDIVKSLNKATYGLHDQNLIQTFKSATSIFNADLPNRETISSAQIDNFALNRDLSDKNMKIMRFVEQVIKPLYHEVVKLQTA